MLISKYDLENIIDQTLTLREACTAQSKESIVHRTLINDCTLLLDVLTKELSYVSTFHADCIKPQFTKEEEREMRYEKRKKRWLVFHSLEYRKQFDYAYRLSCLQLRASSK